MSWPARIEGNIFGLAKLDPEAPMRFKVNIWSNVFGSGGNVAIDGYDESGQRHPTNFGAIHVDSDRSVRDERDHLQSLVDDFNTDLEGNWRDLILDARTRVHAYCKREAAEAKEKQSAIEKGDWANV